MMLKDLPGVLFGDGDSFVLAVFSLEQQPPEEVGEGHGVLLGREDGDHEVGGEAAPPQRLVQYGLQQHDLLIIQHCLHPLSYMQLRESGVEDEDLLLMEADPRAHSLQSRLVLEARLGHIGQNLAADSMLDREEKQTVCSVLTCGPPWTAC